MYRSNCNSNSRVPKSKFHLLYSIIVFVVSDDPLGLNPENCMRTFRTHATC